MRIIAGAFRGRILKTVDGPGYRPAMSRVREAIFSMLASRLPSWSTCSVLDLFAGSGSLAFEAASRGADQITLVEHAASAVRCLRGNADALGLSEPSCRILAGDVARILRTPPWHPFHVVFIDPPYGKNLLPATLTSLLRYGWVSDAAFICAEIERTLRYDAASAHPSLECLADRPFGQTRVLLWQVKNSVSPFIPVPSIR